MVKSTLEPSHILLLLFVVVPFVLWLMSLVSAVRYPDAQWQAAGQNKLVFVVIIVVLGVIGSLVYFFVARPQLLAAGGRIPPPAMPQ